jgi:hypothetical protein
MSTLETGASRFTDPDAAYRMLIEAHRGLTDSASASLDARLVLILANQIGDPEILRTAIDLAKMGEIPVRKELRGG